MQIHDYAAQGDLTGVRRELQRGMNVDARNEQNYTPLATAADSPNTGVDMLRLLIDAGAEVNADAEDSRHFPLELAACSGDLGKVQVLLDASADINKVAPKGYSVLTSIMYALHDNDQLVPMANLLVKHGVDINRESEYGESPLSVASMQGRFDVVEYLLDAGADPSPLKWTPLMRAVAFGAVEDVALLLDEGAAADGEDRFSRTPFKIAAQVGDVRKIALLHDHGCKIDLPGTNRDTALTIAAASGNIDIIRWLIEHGADVEAVNGMDSTPLMIAAQKHTNRLR